LRNQQQAGRGIAKTTIIKPNAAAQNLSLKLVKCFTGKYGVNSVCRTIEFHGRL
jgi:hypothetical protein